MACQPCCPYNYECSCGMEVWMCPICGDSIEQPVDCPGGR